MVHRSHGSLANSTPKQSSYVLKVNGPIGPVHGSCNVNDAELRVGRHHSIFMAVLLLLLFNKQETGFLH